MTDNFPVFARVVAEAAAVKRAVERAAERRKILDAINAKKDQELSQASMDDLLARLAATDA